MADLDKRRVVVAMSGGVDSSVAALLLRDEGYEVIGLHMRPGVEHPEREGGRPTCCSAADAEDARRVAHALGIPFYVLNFREAFDSLIEYFCREYDRARTPNPCILCNRDLKFGRLLTYADAVGAAWVATGHYARVEHSSQRHHLLRGVDSEKDQSYALFALTQEQLGRALFPLGALRKAEVRKIARKSRLKVRDKPESQEICFVPGGNYGEVLRKRIPERIAPGPVVDTEGRVVGTHPGVQLFTIGQRRGLRIALGQPHYVVELRRETNTVVLGPGEHLLRTELLVSDVNWVSISPPSMPMAAQVQIRYRHSAAPATVSPLPENQAHVRFENPVRAITPGQAAVFYSGDVLLGGGWIERPL